MTVPNRHVARLWTAGAIALFVCASILFSQLPSSLFAVADDNKLSLNVELPPAATLETSQEVADRMGEVVRNYSDPNDEKVFESVVKLVGQRSNLVALARLSRAMPITLWEYRRYLWIVISEIETLLTMHTILKSS